MMSASKESHVQHFLELIKKSRRGKLKIYIGMSAGVGKTYRMLQEAQALLRNGVDIKIGYIETHLRKETHALLEGLPVIPRRNLFYKGKELEELDVPAILTLRPEIVIIDELAHTNIEGSKNEKRWQDVMDILDAGINVISAVNIQHIESLHEEVKAITGIDVAERIPDSVLQQADEVVNIDLTADELVTRLREGKIYTSDKIEIALKNFFQSERILQLRELALKEVASQVERKIETELPRNTHLKQERFLACISSNHETAKKVIRKTARLAAYYNSKWWLLYVQTPKEEGDKIGLAAQRHLINNFKLATELGAEVIRVKSSNIAKGIFEATEQKSITTICIGKPHLNLFSVILNTAVFNQLLNKLSAADIDIVILS
jgi:two-component system sensor histidine kinase KdpD